MTTVPFSKVRDRMMADPEFRKEYDALEGEFALVEAMAVAGETLGLPQDLARRLARQTLVGSGALLGSSEQSASDLRIAVTSPGGTTAAALTHLLAEDGLFPLLQRAMDAAALRARELSH